LQDIGFLLSKRSRQYSDLTLKKAGVKAERTAADAAEIGIGKEQL
jgi:hypothetical protein